MNRTEALRLLRGLLKAHGETELALEEPEFTVTIGDLELSFDLHEGALRCRAEIHRFLAAPNRALLDRLSAPELGDWALEDRSLFLELRYPGSLPITRLLTELEALVDQSREWICARLADELG